MSKRLVSRLLGMFQSRTQVGVDKAGNRYFTRVEEVDGAMKERRWVEFKGADQDSTTVPGKSESPSLQSFVKQQFPGTLDQQKGPEEVPRPKDATDTEDSTTDNDRNLHKLKDTIDPISLDNINVLDEWVSEQPSLLCKDDLNWENIDAPFAEPTSDDEELVALDDDEDAPMAAHSWSAADDLYCPQPDQDPYLYVTQDGEP
ncbi:uncharacterized protein C2845_PM03G02080 [Panicum miliaceum]|uniref:Uncharacterized protein n=1 Tax=Panicum miliaceum TaxID=4540 RepID=A0A3L6T991_PANMI|nr:uncharacterized protein C2845_PM03G02080 [Panicum miliaceum]